MTTHNFLECNILPQHNQEIIDIQQEIDRCKLYINELQTNYQISGDCYLSFYPLAKNIRFLSSYFCYNIINGKNPKLSESPRPGEIEFWKEKTKENDWHPWLWGRYFENKNSVKEILENILQPIDDIVDISTLDINYKNKIQNVHVTKFLLYLSCLGHIFRLNKNFENEIIKNYFNYKWPTENVCGLQIRRGEIVSKNSIWSGRKVYSVEEYMTETKKLCSILNTKNIFVSTDSIETIDYLKENYSEYNFYYNNYDRNLFIRYSENWSKEFIDSPSLELQISKKPHLIKHYTESCISDLICLSNCQGYVGGMSMSEYGICGWFLQMAKQQKITPYYNLEGTFDLDKNLFLL
jgi:hypothetical protein